MLAFTTWRRGKRPFDFRRHLIRSLLYGEDPHHRPDIYGKVGNSGVSVANLDDAKKLYSGFDLCALNLGVNDY